MPELTPIELQQQTQRAYDAVAQTYATLLPGLDAEHALDVAMLDDFASRCAAMGGEVVDAGCGTGRVAAHLAAAGLDVTGVDLSPGMIESARVNHPGLRFEVGSLASLPMADFQVAGVLAWYSIIHSTIDELPVIAAEFARVLCRDGWLLVAFQAGAGQAQETDNAYGQAVPMTNIRHDPHVVESVLKDAGFDIAAQLVRAPVGRERLPQAMLLARRRAVLP